MLICYDKAFPEAARALALDGAEIIACISAWPASRTATRRRPRRGPLDAALQPLRPGPRPGEPGRLGRLQPDRHLRLAALRRQRQGRRPGRRRRSPRTGVERRPGRRRRRRRARRSRPRAGRCSTCATAAPTPTRPTRRPRSRSPPMPEMTVTVRWPDGRVEDCYSPSLVMHDHLAAGATYTVADFAAPRRPARSTMASERVRAKFGFACTSAGRHHRSRSRRAAAAYARRRARRGRARWSRRLPRCPPQEPS